MRLLLPALLVLALPALTVAQSTDNYDPSEPLVSNPAPLVAERGTTPVLFNNGPFITSTGDGPGGSNLSTLQGNLSMTTFGAGNQIANGNRIAEDFTVPAGESWAVQGFVFYHYQTGANAANPSTINDIRWQLWDGRPGDAGSTIIAGDLTTNQLQGSSWTNTYRVTDTAPTGTTRPIMESVVGTAGVIPTGIGGGLMLGPGTYWLDWIAGGTLTSGPWQPPVTVLGQTTTGNARQFLGASSAWQDFLDTGTSTPQGAPFLVLGELAGDPEVGLGVSGNSFGTVVVGSTGTGASVTITNTGTGGGDFAWTAVSAPFALTGGTCGSSPATLAAGASCTLQYSFTPTAGGSFSQTVTVSSGASSGQFTLIGEGAAPLGAVMPIPTMGQWAMLLLGAVLLLVAGRRLSARSH